MQPNTYGAPQAPLRGAVGVLERDAVFGFTSWNAHAVYVTIGHFPAVAVPYGFFDHAGVTGLMNECGLVAVNDFELVRVQAFDGHCSVSFRCR